MLRLCAPELAIAPEALERPGGFAWWYADLLNERGDGLVLIWSYGLPFLPGPTPLPRKRPALNLAIYRAGRPEFYLLQECEAEASENRWRFDRSVIERSLDARSFRLDVHLDCALPGTSERLKGHIHMEGARCLHDAPMGLGDAPHRWGPVSGPSRGEVELTLGDARFAFSGSAYHDCNSSPVPLGELGVREWIWGRASSAHEDRIWYLLEPERGDALAIAYSVGAEGTVRQVESLRVERDALRRDRYGARWPSVLRLYSAGRLWLTVRCEEPVDRGPFYLRFVGRAEHPDGTRAPCMQELVLPGAVGQLWQRPFVRMRVHDLRGDNSYMLPWFVGARAGRITRLLRQWGGVGG